MSQIQIVQIDRDDLLRAVEGIVMSGFDKLQATLKTFREPYEEETYLTPAEAAKFLKVNLSTISNWRKEGKLESYFLGGRVYIKRSDIDSCMTKITAGS